MRPDRRGVQPRLGVAWRPVPGSSLVVRGGYGVYRNTNVYQSIAMLLAQQPPLSKAFSVENSADHPLTLANGFIAAPGRPAEHVCGRSRLPRRLRPELAGVGAARSAGVADRAGDLSGDQGQPPDAGVPAQHLSGRRRESVSVVSGGLRVSHVERPLDAARRPDSGAAPAPQRPDGDGPVHVGEGDRRCRRVHRREPERRGDRAGLAESRRPSGGRRTSISVTR